MAPSVRTCIWIPSKVTKQIDPRSYVVQTEDGREYRRNRRDLLKSRETSLQELDPPNILSRQHLSTIPVDNQCTPSVQSSPLNLPNHSQEPETMTAPIANPKSEAYITRSGRVVKPRTIISM
jgi:hypothetical protein